MNMNLITLMDEYGTDEACRELLTELRWPDGVACPRCGDLKHQYDSKSHQYDCAGCGYKFSVTTGNLMHDTHLPLRKWFLATYIMCESKKGVSSAQLQRNIRVAKKTGWYLTHRIRAAMAVANPEPLSGIVEVDETYIGGKVRGEGRGEVTTNGIEGEWALFKRAIIGSYHQLSIKHLDAYLDKFAWRQNNRENPYLFHDTLTALLTTEAMPYSELVEK